MMNLPSTKEIQKLLSSKHPQAVDELMELLEGIAEDERHSAWERYEPMPSQLKFHKSLARVRLYCGGNRAGKTTAGMIEAIWYMMGRHPYRTVLSPNSGWIVALDNEVLADVILPKLFEYLPEDLIKSFNKVKGVLELKNGSLCKFKSCDSGAEKFQSAERRWIWFDEEPPQEVWNECLIRVGARYPLDVWMTMTPLKGMDWSYDEIEQKQKPGEIEVFGASFVDNYHILPSERQRIIEKYEHTDEANARLHGHYFHKSGLIYKGLRPELHLVDPFPIPEHWPFIRIIDPHPRKPSAAIWVAVSPGNHLYVTDELNDPEEILLSEFAQRVKEIDGKRYIVRSLIDPAARQGTAQTGMSTQEYLSQPEIGLHCEFANNNVTFGYDAVRKRLQGPDGPTIHIFNNCWKTWKQLTHLVYEEWRHRGANRDVREVQRKVNDDLADCVRYACSEQFEYSDPRMPPPDYVPRSSTTGY